VDFHAALTVGVEETASLNLASVQIPEEVLAQEVVDGCYYHCHLCWHLFQCENLPPNPQL